MQDQCATRFIKSRIWFFIAFLTAAILLVVPAKADPTTSSSVLQETPENTVENLLDGHSYRATIVRTDKGEGDAAKPLGDQLVFSNGKFSSEICKKFNFAEAPYWLRAEDGTIHFLAELTSPTDGKMVWEGTVHGGMIDGTMRWTKKRWYWTIEAEHKIHGEVEGDSGNAAHNSN